MLSRRDPLANPRPLIDAVYSFVAYRMGPGADAEDVTAETFARAARYRATYDPAYGEPIMWLIGIARRCIADARAQPRHLPLEAASGVDSADVEALSVQRLQLRAAVAALTPRERELVALRFGAGLSTRQVASALGLTHGAARVALHRAVERLRSTLDDGSDAAAPRGELATTGEAT